ncbi:MAG: radical SAM protein [Candidatus Omnitrophota bacterium]
MFELNEVKISRILNPTSIDLGEFVINPFMGCVFSCLYCYVKSNSVISKRKKPWGGFLDVRVNAPELLEKEILVKKPEVVLLGSTTECFQPAEKEYKLTKRILEILNKHKVYYVILSRSALILDYLDLLKQGFCKRIYFTVNNFGNDFKQALEPKSPAFNLRDEAVNKLLENNLPVIPYFSPILPWVSDIRGIFLKFERAEAVEFECLNFRLGNIKDIVQAIAQVSPDLKVNYEKMLVDQGFYFEAWENIKKGIAIQAKSAKKEYSVYVHDFGGYFKNKYIE